MPQNERDAAADLARRIRNRTVDPSREDEAHRPPGDRSPSYADVLMSEAPRVIERSPSLSTDDWKLIAKALEFYANASTP